MYDSAHPYMVISTHIFV